MSRTIRAQYPGGITRIETIPDQTDLDRAYQQGYRAARRNPHPPGPNPDRVRAEAAALAATIPPDPPHVIAKRQEVLTTW